MRKVSIQACPVADARPMEFELQFQELDNCLQKLNQRDRELIIKYYQEDRQAKIDFRKRLAEELGVTQTTLRARAYKIRQTLHECMCGGNCNGKGPQNGKAQS